MLPLMVGDESRFSSDMAPSSATDDTTAVPKHERGDGWDVLVKVLFHVRPLSSEYLCVGEWGVGRGP